MLQHNVNSYEYDFSCLLKYCFHLVVQRLILILVLSLVKGSSNLFLVILLVELLLVSTSAISRMIFIQRRYGVLSSHESISIRLSESLVTICPAAAVQPIGSEQPKPQPRAKPQMDSSRTRAQEIFYPKDLLPSAPSKKMIQTLHTVPTSTITSPLPITG